MSKKVITYGTFDMFHIGHLNLIERARSLGDELIVAVSTDEFNQSKGKKTLISFEQRKKIIQSIKFVDLAIAERDWSQKIEDIKRYDIDIFVIGDDWKGKFDFLKPYCEVVYLERTKAISSTGLKEALKGFYNLDIEKLENAVDTINMIVKAIK